jgi:heme exporter protein B
LRYILSSFKAVCLKDLIAELRAKQVLPSMLVLGLLIMWILRLASSTSSIDLAVTGPAALWAAILFSGLLVQERSFSVEHDSGCLEALLLAPVDAGTVYLAKLAVNVVMLCVFEIVIVPAAVLMFRLNVTDWPMLLAVLLLGNLAVSGVGTLFSALVCSAGARGAVLSVVVLAVLMPVMVPAVFALMVVFGAVPAALVGTGALAFVGSLGSAVGYMAAFDAVFVAACWLLFGVAVRD